MQDAIGQNQVLVPPIEMALVAEAIANQGVILQPHVVDCVLDPNGRPASRVGVQQYKRAIDPATAAAMTTYMSAVVNDPRGTGTAARIPGIAVAGKTGTAETATGQNPHAWFIALAPADHPRAHPRPDGHDRAPAAERLAENCDAAAIDARLRRGEGDGGDDVAWLVLSE